MDRRLHRHRRCALFPRRSCLPKLAKADTSTLPAGGSTIGAVASLVERNPYAFEGFGLDIGVDAHELKRELELFEAGETPASGETVAQGAGVVVGREGGGKAAARVWDLVRCASLARLALTLLHPA